MGDLPANIQDLIRSNTDAASIIELFRSPNDAWDFDFLVSMQEYGVNRIYTMAKPPSANEIKKTPGRFYELIPRPVRAVVVDGVRFYYAADIAPYCATPIHRARDIVGKYCSHHGAIKVVYDNGKGPQDHWFVTYAGLHQLLIAGSCRPKAAGRPANFKPPFCDTIREQLERQLLLLYASNERAKAAMDQVGATQHELATVKAECASAISKAQESLQMVKIEATQFEKKATKSRQLTAVTDKFMVAAQKTFTGLPVRASPETSRLNIPGRTLKRLWGNTTQDVFRMAGGIQADIQHSVHHIDGPGSYVAMEDLRDALAHDTEMPIEVVDRVLNKLKGEDAKRKVEQRINRLKRLKQRLRARGQAQRGAVGNQRRRLITSNSKLVENAYRMLTKEKAAAKSSADVPIEMVRRLSERIQLRTSNASALVYEIDTRACLDQSQHQEEEGTKAFGKSIQKVVKKHQATLDRFMHINV